MVRDPVGGPAAAVQALRVGGQELRLRRVGSGTAVGGREVGGRADLVGPGLEAFAGGADAEAEDGVAAPAV